MNYLNEINYKYLCEGLTYEPNDWKVLDHLLTEFNRRDGIIDQIVRANQNEGFSHQFDVAGPQLTFSMDTYSRPGGGSLSTADVGIYKPVSNVQPQLHLTLQSPSLDVPQRIEMPLKYILKGLPPLRGTHMVYLHAIGVSDGSKHVYYGRTRRGWMKRFNEHVKLAMKGSSRKFPDLYGKAIAARYDQLFGRTAGENPLVYNGSNHVICGAGMDKESAIAAERYLIKKYSLGVANGLNMV